MTWYEEMTWCDGCGVEITWGPVLAEGRAFCCSDCSQGFPCTCGERMELDEEQRGVEAASTPTNSGYMA
jgi:hypothetical protein